ncbi:MAG: hypothetical protein Kow0092_20000 [Deferrisomatales bacterium]
MSIGRARPEQASRYRYVDFAARRRPGFRNCVVPVSEVPALVARYGAYGCYATFYLFDEGLLRYAGEHLREGRPSVAGYAGPVRAPVWPLDVDAPELEAALEAARGLFEHLTARWGIAEEGIRLFFSGKKGFHLLVDSRALGDPAPSEKLPGVLHRLTRRLSGEMGFPPGGPLDLALKDRVRLLRLPNTRHEASGRFKIPLTAQELRTLSVGEILELARGPRPWGHADPTGLLGSDPVPVAPPARARLRAAAAAGARGRAFAPPGPLRGEAVLGCPARRTLLETPAPEGQRNNTAIRLASWLREGGLSAEETEARLLAWNRRNPSPLDEVEVRHVVASAYAAPTPYRYGCRDPLIAVHCPSDPEGRRRCPYHVAARPEEKGR